MKRRDRIVNTVPIFIGSARYTFCILHLLQYFDLCIKGIARKILLFTLNCKKTFLLESVFKNYNLYSVTPLFCLSLSLSAALSLFLFLSFSLSLSLSLSFFHSLSLSVCLSLSLSLSLCLSLSFTLSLSLSLSIPLYLSISLPPSVSLSLPLTATALPSHSIPTATNDFSLTHSLSPVRPQGNGY